MPVSVFGTKRPKFPPTRPPRSTTLRDFGGGWDAIDSDENMSPKFSVELNNWYCGTDNSLIISPGSMFFADVSSVVNGNIIDTIYFNARLIHVMDTGEIATVDVDGNAEAIWNATIAALLVGSADPWSSGLTRVNFVPFKGKMVIHNGIDKPIVLDDDYSVSYLCDEATGSNVNTPVGQFGATVGNYHVIAATTSSPTEVVVSSAGTIGTFPSDPAPNDAISFDVGARAPTGAPTIRGIAGFRNYLLIFFRESTLVVTLGQYSSDATPVHTPAFNDTLPQFGSIGHRTIVPIENDILFGDPFGVATAKRNLLAGLIESQHASAIIGPGYVRSIGPLTDTQLLENTFGAYNSLLGQYMLFVPGGTVFVYSFNADLRTKAWSKYTWPDYTSACTSKQGRVFVTKGSKVYRLHNTQFDEQAYAHLILDRDATWMNATGYTIGQKLYDSVTEEVYTALVDHTSALGGTFEDDRTNNPTYWELYEGEGIDASWELPWMDYQEAERWKRLVGTKIGSKGTARFTLQAFVDGLFKDEDGVEIYDPALEIEFVGGSQTGFGGTPGQDYGANRISNDPRIYKTPMRFKRIKFRIVTDGAREPLQISTLTTLYRLGKYT